jgi:hypothetical protein
VRTIAYPDAICRLDDAPAREQSASRVNLTVTILDALPVGLTV